MSDFDEQLRAALERGAEDAPGAAGLAATARRRLTVRRRRTVALAATAAVVAVVVPTAVIATAGDGQSPQPAGPTPVPEQTKDVKVYPDLCWGGGYGPEGAKEVLCAEEDGRRTVTFDSISVDVPSDWIRADCAGQDHFTPTGECAGGNDLGLRFLNDTFEPAMAEGELVSSSAGEPEAWAGYVYADEWAVLVATPSRALTRQILASVRAAGDEETDAEWREFSWRGVTVVVPAEWTYTDCPFVGARIGPPPRGEECQNTSGAHLSPAAGFDESPRVEPGRAYEAGGPGGEASSTGYVIVGDVLVQVDAETPALVERILASAQGGSGALPCDPSGGFPKSREGCPDPDPETGWLTRDDDGQLWFEPFRSYTNDAEGRAYAQEHDLEYPYPGDNHDASVGDPRPFDLDAVSICSGSIQVASPLRQDWDTEVPCRAFLDAYDTAPERADTRIPVAIWSGSGVPVLQLSELYRP